MACQRRKWSQKAYADRMTTLHCWLGNIVAKIRLKCKKTGIQFDLDAADLEPIYQAGRCQVTGIEFDLRPGAKSPWTPTIDRIDPKLGYTKENVRVVCWIYNRAKNNWSDADVLRLAEALLDDHARIGAR